MSQPQAAHGKHIILQHNPTKDDTEWKFTLPATAFSIPPKAKNPELYGKFIKFTATHITFQMQLLPNNRILQSDDKTKFILLSFGDLRFPETTLKATAEYMTRLFKMGLFLNGVQYRFYHHSNSQLRSRSCLLREATSDSVLDERINAWGDFSKIKSAAKRAKRIGLLFSEAQLDFDLDPKYVKDIEDIKLGDELFSDGCGLISRRLAVQLAKEKKIIFRGKRYTPTVFQIRYRGYKGVLMLHPQLDALAHNNKNEQFLVHFRKSMKKFNATQNNTFSVVDYSAPYSFGRLNNDIIVLLSSLGITNEKLLAKQQEYFNWIQNASLDTLHALDFLSAMDQETLTEGSDSDQSLASQILLDGVEAPAVAQAIRKLQMRELSGFKNERNQKDRSRMIIRKSRLIFGVCDPFGVLREGEVHIRITAGRDGATTPINGNVLVVRNPCLHPGKGTV
ncbi:hypothetical protein MIND_01237600 [Mycena indigotica]|uniref:RNA-dependent RNA polymerase n=1 Tax=Mycena indigotica TaxID=2126181 RepID=A0A8H6VSE4_9AGAR|nr:uncharacterized protein MIND_01237600 [Mycena indigotica]KAF7292109.1 hypothetical protein MIND_01237600 [Mycena indigotica]